MMDSYPLLKGSKLFRKNESIFINKSSELEEYCNIMHRHDFIEISYVASGEGIHIVGDYKYDISVGDLFIINYTVPHGFFPKTGSNKPPLVYNCVFMPGFIDASLFSSKHFEDITSSFLFKSLFPDDHTPKPDLSLKGTDFLEVGELFNKMHFEYTQTSKGYIDIIRAYLIELLVKIFRMMDSGGGINRQLPSARNKALVENALNYMKENYKSEIKLDDLAMKSFISKNYFSKLFKEVTGSNFSEYIHKIRINEACQLLRSTDLKISDVAYSTGFKDLKFFYEIFKKFTGKTPGEFRGN